MKIERLEHDGEVIFRVKHKGKLGSSHGDYVVVAFVEPAGTKDAKITLSSSFDGKEIFQELTQESALALSELMNAVVRELNQGGK